MIDESYKTYWLRPFVTSNRIKGVNDKFLHSSIVLFSKEQEIKSFDVSMNITLFFINCIIMKLNENSLHVYDGVMAT